MNVRAGEQCENGDDNGNNEEKFKSTKRLLGQWSKKTSDNRII